MLDNLRNKYNRKLETDFLPEALEIVEKPASPLGHFAIWTTIIIVIAFIIWACVGKLDEVAVASARVVPKNGVQIVQSMYEGTITEIMVEEGEFVTKGQALIKLDSTTEQIGLDAVSEQLSDLELENKLLLMILADEDIKNYVYENEMNDREIQIANLIISMQNEYISQMSQYESQVSQYSKQVDIEINNLNKIKENLDLLLNQRTELDALYNGGSPENKALEAYITILDNARNECAEYERLYSAGAVSKAQYDEKQTALNKAEEQYELQLVKAEHETAGNTANLDSINNQIQAAEKDVKSQSELVAKQEELLLQAQSAVTSAQYQFQQTITDRIVSNNRQIAELGSEYEIRLSTQNYQVLTSPVDGTVQSIAANTIGGVVTSAQSVISIVPKNAELIVEAQVLNRDIGYISIGQEVSVKLDTFSFQKYGTLKGKIIYVSPSAVEDDRKGQVYIIKVEIDEHLKGADGKEPIITSGMSGTAEIKLEDRKIIEFFLEPIFEYFDNSLKLR